MVILELSTKENSWAIVKNKHYLQAELKKKITTLINQLTCDFETGIGSCSWLQKNRILTKQHKYNLIYNLFTETINLNNFEEVKIPLKKLFKKLNILFQEVESPQKQFTQVMVHALKSKNDWIAKKILKLTSGIQIQDDIFLFEAIHSNCSKTLKYILENMKFTHETITSAIFILCKTPSTDAEIILQLIVLDDAFDINCENTKQQTPLFAAYESSNLEAFKRLLNLGASLKYKNSLGKSVKDLMCSCFANNSFNPIAIEAIKDYNKID